jgi:hypothetical protein
LCFSSLTHRRVLYYLVLCFVQSIDDVLLSIDIGYGIGYGYGYGVI